MHCFGLYSFANYLSPETHCVRLIFALPRVQEGMILLLIYFNTLCSSLIYYSFDLFLLTISLCLVLC